ncbi:hypothetical protein PRK78_006763 [Emydomyces testavorans]|uniref:Uncharacterized protein n=1 Tax=Emydomyces testavorans TaxID=2070801 RepID=A0AAF0IL33_9EURO|nr:hypothetical protein PRK78_006763 [Emydomyces testavorans]
MASQAAHKGFSSPHDPQPKSLKVVLNQTTSVPVYCHPRMWSDFHLGVLRARHLDETYPLEHVIGRPILCDPSDSSLRKVVEEISKPGNPEGDFQSYIAYILKLMNIRGRENEKFEEWFANLCCEWLERMREEVRKYPRFEFANGRRSTPTINLELHFAGETASMKGAFVLYDFPDYNNYPTSYYPIVSILRMDHDAYRPRNPLSEHREQLRVKRWEQRSKPAELVAILLAMAQKQAQRLDKKRFNRGDDPRLNAFHPILITVSENKVRFIRAHVSLEYLNALANPAHPLRSDLVVEQSEDLDLLVESDRIRYLIAVTAILDEYFLGVRPIFSQYKD